MSELKHMVLHALRSILPLLGNLFVFLVSKIKLKRQKKGDRQ